MGLLLNILTTVGYLFVAVGTGLIWSPAWTVGKMSSGSQPVEKSDEVAWYLCGAFQVGVVVYQYTV